ncbi:hypothetical protein Sgly_2994 [Syntrophobotulus glycolicus DSM 8271]|uniref:Outer membrane efflux protein n=1 Tax=Syntrophobotulus glycolicus (strain DSM 8271 / FlGlyR) TaxID=645991 RepID=F0SZU2_SYNGF|nr:hypothetical protein [Syntrophobotulus glycolicus]ADY57263.1 hypothetical protein Sgly_2994 [Syntrophobotulus glycolicus DSM 8271]
MKKLHRTRTIFCLALAGLLVFPSCLWADAKNEEDILKVEFSEIGPLVEIHNLTANEAADSIEDSEEAKQDGLNAIDNAILQLDLLSSTLILTDFTLYPNATPTHDDILYALLTGQKQSLNQQRRSLSVIDVDKLEIQRDMAIDIVTSSLETVYISYNSLGRQLELLNVQKDLADAQLSALVKQQDLGMVAEVVVNKTKNEIRALENSIKQLERSRQTLKEQFNLTLSYEFDRPLEIGEVPGVMRSLIVTTDVEYDYKHAWEDSYNVVLNEDEDSETEADAIRNFRHGFYSAYQTMLDKQDTLELENTKLKTVETDYEIAKQKHILGMISDLQFKTEENGYYNQKIVVKLAEDTVYQAYRNYEWAKRGLIVSSPSSSATGE